jgi:hypothetical protein
MFNTVTVPSLTVQRRFPQRLLGQEAFSDCQHNRATSN